jgi:hypothetical protein
MVFLTVVTAGRWKYEADWIVRADLQGTGDYLWTE